MNTDIFKAYDIRGIYPTEFNEETAYKTGRALVEVLNAKTVAVGRDARKSGETLYKNLLLGITDSGADVIDLGLVSTPMIYFASGTLNVDAAVMLTASHNPPEYNGMKICKKNAVPVGGDSGLMNIRDLAFSSNFSTILHKGIIKKHDIKSDYYEAFAEHFNLGEKKFRIVIDIAHAMGQLELPIYEYVPNNIQTILMYDGLTKPFSVHEANPLKTETLIELQERVVLEKADFGISYDGDADRIGFVDENGVIVPMDIVTGLLAQILLPFFPPGYPATVLYDLRSSKAVPEAIKKAGGIPKECRVGHAFIKRQMIDDNAIFAGELSGHYYFQKNFNAEASTFAAILIMNLMAETGKTLSELVSSIQKYFHSGEINSEVSNKEDIMIKLKKIYSDGALTELDGIKISYKDWWFNVRPSNTEPVLRLNLEAETKEQMIQKRDEVLHIIRS